MTLTTTVVGLCLVLENTDLRTFALFQNLSGYFRIGNGGLANLDIVSSYEENLVKGYFCADFRVKLFHGQLLAYFYAVLLSACFDNSVHVCTSF